MRSLRGLLTTRGRAFVGAGPRFRSRASSSVSGTSPASASCSWHSPTSAPSSCAPARRACASSDTSRRTGSPSARTRTSPWPSRTSRRPRRPSSSRRSGSTTCSATARGSSSGASRPRGSGSSTTPSGRTCAGAITSAACRAGPGSVRPRHAQRGPGGDGGPRHPAPGPPVVRQPAAELRRGVRRRARPPHRPARRGRRDHPRVPRRRRPAPDPLAGHGTHRRPHGSPGGPAGPAPRRRPARPRPDAHGGSGATGSFEWAVSACASIAAHLCESGYAVHLVCPETVDSGRVADTLQIDEILDVLATTALRPKSTDDLLLRAAQGLAATGGFVVAIVGPRGHEVTGRLASLRQPGTTGLALVLDSRAFGQTPATADGGGGGIVGPDEVEPHVDALRLAGWRAIRRARRGRPARVGGAHRRNRGRHAMTRRRWRITVLAALATLAAVYPITSLFTSARWLPDAMLVIGLTAALGLLLRGLTVPAAHRAGPARRRALRRASPLHGRHVQLRHPNGADRRAGQLARARGDRDDPAQLRPSAAHRRGRLLPRRRRRLSSPCSSTRWRRPGARLLPQDSPC